VIVTTLVSLGVDQIVAGDLRAAIGYLREAHRVAEAHGYQHLAAGVAVNVGFVPPRRSCRQCPTAADQRPRRGGCHRREDLCARCHPRPRASRRPQPRPHRRRHSARRRRSPVRADWTGLRRRRRTTARQSPCPAARRARACRVRCRQPAWSPARPGRSHRPCPEHRQAEHCPARSSPCARRPPFGRRERSDRQATARGRPRRSAVGPRAADPGAACRRASNAKIAETLFVTPNTVRTHLDRIRDKTGARNRAELTRYALQAGIEPVVPAP
jgi:Bacterial regulatory proteins, luxR family